MASLSSDVITALAAILAAVGVIEQRTFKHLEVCTWYRQAITVHGKVNYRIEGIFTYKVCHSLFLYLFW